MNLPPRAAKPAFWDMISDGEVPRQDQDIVGWIDREMRRWLDRQVVATHELAVLVLVEITYIGEVISGDAAVGEQRRGFGSSAIAGEPSTSAVKLFDEGQQVSAQVIDPGSEAAVCRRDRRSRGHVRPSAARRRRARPGTSGARRRSAASHRGSAPARRR